MNRSKTRKWVEARQQTYDGDDWGNDDYDQEPDSPPYPQQQQPPVPASSRLASYGQRTPSTGPASSSVQPTALHIPAQQQVEPPAQVTYIPADAAPSYGSEPSSMADPSRTGAQEQLVSPQDPGVIRSPDADSQAQHTSAPAFATSQATASTETGHLEHLGHVGRKNTTRKPVGGATAAVESSTISDGNATAQPASVNKNFSSTDSGPEFGADKVVESAVLAPQGEVSASQLEHQSFEDDRQLHEGDKIDRQRLSTSPQLPDVARM